METFLPILWFVLIAVLWTGYLFLEGFDFGVGMLLKLIGKDEKDRRVMLSAIGPHWDGNEVWLLTAGGATFAAFPEWYATLFSGAYLALFLILLALIVRISAIEWRGKINDPVWRDRWDTMHVVTAWIPSIVWGVAFANMVAGFDLAKVPATFADGATSVEMAGGLMGLITLLINGYGFTLLGGVVTCTLFLSHGAIFLALKTTGDLKKRSESYAVTFSLAALVSTGVWAIWAQLVYSNQTWSWLPLLVAALALVGTVVAAIAKREGWAFISNGVAVIGAVAFIFTAMAPYVMKSMHGAESSLTIFEAASSTPTLTIMSVLALVFVPIVLAYQAWTYWVFARRIARSDLPETPAGLHPTRIRDFA